MKPLVIKKVGDDINKQIYEIEIIVHLSMSKFTKSFINLDRMSSNVKNNCYLAIWKKKCIDQ
jgi:hypothetical protein